MDIVENILFAIVCIVGIYSVADHVNDMHDLEEDKYLPKEYQTMSRLFYFSHKPVRFQAYWMERVAQFFFFTYFSGLIIGRIITRSFEFVYSTVFGYYPFVMFCFPLFSHIGVLLYIQLRKYKDGKEK